MRKRYDFFIDDTFNLLEYLNEKLFLNTVYLYRYGLQVTIKMSVFFIAVIFIILSFYNFIGQVPFQFVPSEPFNGTLDAKVKFSILQKNLLICE